MLKEGMFSKIKNSNKLVGSWTIPPLTPEDIEAGRQRASDMIDKNYEDAEELKKRIKRLQAFNASKIKMRMKKGK